MIWFLLIVAGGSTSQSGIGLDTRQTFPSEAECIATRDQVRAFSTTLGEGGRYPQANRTMSAHCVSRPSKIGR